MAWLEMRGSQFHVGFRYGEARFKRSLHTSDGQEAEQLLARVERKLALIQQGDLAVPVDVDPIDCVLANGSVDGGQKA